MKRLCVCVVVFLLVACAPASVDAAEQPTTRYPVIADMLALEQRVDTLERDLRESRDQIAVLTLLRAHDVEVRQAQIAQDRLEADARHSDDLKRLYALELAVYGDGAGCPVR